MRTRSEIIQSIANKLTSINWSRLKNSLVGKELIAFGGEVVASVENVKDTLVDTLDYEKADFAGLISLSQINDVWVSGFKPAFIKVKLKGIITPLVFKPFDLQFSTGSATFTNIDYCTSSDELILYQGVVKTALTSGTPDQYSGYRVDTEIPYEITNIPSSDNTVKNFLILGESVMPESIYLFKRYENVVSQISQYHPLRYGSDVEQYKVRTLSDMKQTIQFGDGVWGKSDYDAGTDFQAIWLELSNNEFASEGTLTSTEYGSYSQNQVEILASGFADSMNIEYARYNYKKNMLITSVVASKEQIREFTNSYPFVLDSNVVLFDEQDYTLSTIAVYIKPTDPNDQGGFGEVEEALDLHGNIFSIHHVQLANPLLFSVLVYANYNNQVQQFLVDRFAYNNLAYKEIISAAATAGEIQSLYQLSNYILFRVYQDQSLLSLMSPIQGTIRLLDANNQVVGFDSHGIIYRLIESSNSDHLYGFGSSYGSSFLSNHFWDEDNRKAYKQELFNLYSGETSAARGLASLLVSELKFDINSQVYHVDNTDDYPLSGLRLKNETIDEFPVILCTYPLDGMTQMSGQDGYTTTNLEVVAKAYFNDPSHYPTPTPGGTYYTEIDYDYAEIVTWVNPSTKPTDSGVYPSCEVIATIHYTEAEYSAYSDELINVTEGTLENCSLTIQVVVVNSTVTEHPKAISFNVFIDSMLWNFPDTNANNLLAMRTLEITEKDIMNDILNEDDPDVLSQEARELVNYYRSNCETMPQYMFAPKVKFLNDTLYVVGTTSKGLALYIFHIDHLNGDVEHNLISKIILTNNNKAECCGIVVLDNNIIIKSSIDNTFYYVRQYNGVFTLMGSINFTQLSALDNNTDYAYIYQSKDEICIVTSVLRSGTIYDFHYYVASGISIINQEATLIDFEELLFTENGNRTYNDGSKEGSGYWTSFPQISFVNKNYIGLIWNWESNGTRLRTAGVVDRSTLEVDKYSADNSAQSGNSWKFPNYSGTINYDTGVLNPGSVVWKTTQYDTAFIKVTDEKYYPKLKTQTPVIWM